MIVAEATMAFRRPPGLAFLLVVGGMCVSATGQKTQDLLVEDRARQLLGLNERIVQSNFPDVADGTIIYEGRAKDGPDGLETVLDSQAVAPPQDIEDK